MGALEPTVSTPRVVLFDVDGTLLTTGGAGARAWGLAFEQVMGVPADITEHAENGMVDHTVAQLTFRAVVGRPPTSAELGALFDAYRARLSDTVAESSGFRVLPGVRDLLEQLTEEGVLLGVTSGNIEPAATVKLRHARLDQYFAVRAFGARSNNRAVLTRSAIDRAARLLDVPLLVEEVMSVGDTPRDVAAARSVGAVSVGVATGTFTQRRLLDAGADHVLANLEHGLPFVAGRTSGRSATLAASEVGATS